MFGVSTIINGLVCLETNLFYQRSVRFLYVHVDHIELGTNFLVK